MLLGGRGRPWLPRGSSGHACVLPAQASSGHARACKAPPPHTPRPAGKSSHSSPSLPAPRRSLGLGLTPARPVRSQQRHKTSTRSSANERANETAFDLEAAATLAKDWDALSSLASFDDVQAFYARRK